MDASLDNVLVIRPAVTEAGLSVCGKGDDTILVKGEGLDSNLEYFCYGETDKGHMLHFSDGTILEIKFIIRDDRWKIKIVRAGSQFLLIDTVASEDIFTDVAKFKSGITYFTLSRDWEVRTSSLNYKKAI